MRRRSSATSTRTNEPGETAEPNVVIAIPLVVGALMFGQLVASGRVTERNGFEAFRVGLGLELPSLGTSELARFRAHLEKLGVTRFAAAWQLLVAYVDRVGVERAKAELNAGVFYRRPVSVPQ